jgi:hypothetical protein
MPTVVLSDTFVDDNFMNDNGMISFVESDLIEKLKTWNCATAVSG